MPKTRKRQRTPITADPGPVKPGSPLHRALELVAREVAKSLRPIRHRGTNDGNNADEVLDVPRSCSSWLFECTRLAGSPAGTRLNEPTTSPV